MNKIIWLTGESGAGKTTVGKPLADCLDGVLLDGDEMRSSISLGAGFSREDRTEHNLRVARLAKILQQYVNVVVSVIAPMADVRKQITEICNPLWVWIYRSLPDREGHFYETPGPDEYKIALDHDILSPEQSLRAIISLLDNEKEAYSYFIGRYQPFHEGHIRLIHSVLDEGKRVCIALRDTPLRANDPYTVYAVSYTHLTLPTN